MTFTDKKRRLKLTSIYRNRFFWSVVRLLRIFRLFLEKLTGLTVLRAKPRGLDFYSDIKKVLPELAESVIFDVGANFGQTSIPLANAFKNSTIYAIEPSQANFDILKEKIRKKKNIKALRFGMGSERGQKKLLTNNGPSMFRIDECAGASVDHEIINVITLDDYCCKHSIEEIGLLKIDTEGYDLEVLKGAGSLLKLGKIKLIYTEVSMNRTNKAHVYFQDVIEFLARYGFEIYGIYEQIGEWVEKKQLLRRSNILFVSKDVAESELSDRY